MFISRNWLQNFFDTPLPSAQEIADALTFHAFEIDGIEKKGEDDILDIKVTPNRGHDCLSHRGIASELSAILKLPLNAKDPFAKKPEFSRTASAVKVVIDTPLCKRYIAAHIKGVTVGPSPEWLTKSLESIGQRSINNVVDATNLVMFNTGQPLHAFDAKRLRSLALGVRTARAGEELEALDKKRYALKETMLVITAADRPVGIAGVKGGEADRIDSDTKDILIESATFDGVTIRKAAQALKLRTDASARFEQVLSPELAAYGMQQVVELIAAIAGGEVEGFVDAYPEPQEQKQVAVTLAQINRALGTELTAAEVADVFARLQLAYKEEQGVFTVLPPLWRLDLEISEDLIEEVGRIVGYDRVAAQPLPPPTRPPAINSAFYAAEAKREELAAQGYSEVYTSVFSKKGERAVLNKVDSVKPFLRTNLTDGLKEAYEKNLPNKELLGLAEIKLFEIGTVWRNSKEETLVGTADKSGVREEPLLPAEAPAYTELPLSATPRYRPFSRYPYIVRDIAAWVPVDTQEAEVLTLIRKEAGELAVRADLFDRFQKDGRVSLAYRVIFQSFERTLEDKDANERMEKVADALRSKGFEIR
jgi:phenylalanyl-tRNA synthetase beta chain